MMVNIVNGNKTKGEKESTIHKLLKVYSTDDVIHDPSNLLQHVCQRVNSRNFTTYICKQLLLNIVANVTNVTPMASYIWTD